VSYIKASLIALAALCALGAPVPCSAQLLELRPVELDFSQQHKAQSFTLVNRAAQPATVQVRAFQWSQGVDGKDVLTPTQDIMFSPPFVELGPGESQVVRVKFLGVPKDAESAYRVFIDELPVRADSGIKTALRLSMPAFVSPLFGKPAKVSWLWSDDGRGGSYVTVINSGGQHAMVADVKIKTQTGRAVTLPADGSAYILSGAARRWRLDGGSSADRRPQLQVAGTP
jgi:fimbrial chaperone protein